MIPLVTPIPNLNGNSATSLINQLLDVKIALEAVLKAMSNASDITHGRNFQTMPDGHKAQIEATTAWRERMLAIHAIREEIMAMALEIQRYDNR